MSYTKGKWKIRDKKQDWADGAVFDIDDEDGRHLAFVGRSTAGIDGDEALANAQLIASAPDMHKAIESFAIWYNTLAHLNPDSFIQLKEIIPNHLINNLAQAIQKAEGNNDPKT